MKIRIGYLAIGLLCVGSLCAQSPANTGQAANQSANRGWDFLNTLKTGKHGDLILIRSMMNVDDDTPSQRCRLVSVEASSLTCALEHSRKRPFVMQQKDVQAIYWITKEGEHHPILTIAGGLLGFGLGGGISDGGTNWPLAIIGGAIGSSFGIVKYLTSRHEVFQLVYVHRSPPAAIASSDKSNAGAPGNSTANIADPAGP